MRRFTALVSLCVASAFPHITEAKVCANEIEATAFDLRALKSSMMVAALSCGQQTEYNTFMKKHDALFNRSGKTINAFFTRNYGRRAKQETNRFITNLANEASRYSMAADSNTYCEQTARFFSNLTETDSRKIAEYAINATFTRMHGVSECPDNNRMVARN